MRWFVVLFHFAVTSTNPIWIRCQEWSLQNTVMEKATWTSLNVAWYFMSQHFNKLANTLVVQNRRFGPAINGVHEWGKHSCQPHKLLSLRSMSAGSNGEFLACFRQLSHSNSVENIDYPGWHPSWVSSVTADHWLSICVPRGFAKCATRLKIKIVIHKIKYVNWKISNCLLTYTRANTNFVVSWKGGKPLYNVWK